MNQKKIIVLEGPSGVGKDTVIHALIKKNPNKYQKIVSYTTREPRIGEIDGVTYYYIDEKTFQDKIKSGDVFEYTIRHGTYRGMSKQYIDSIINNGKIALKEADVVGLTAIKKMYKDQVVSIFITADKNVIKKRLIKRGDKDIDIRLADYDNVHKTKEKYDYIITNNGSVNEAVRKINKILGD